MMDTKVCATCGRSFEWRKKWEKNWTEVKYCSDRCRARKSKTRREDMPSTGFKDAILNLLNSRSQNVSICPSEVLPLEQRQNKMLMEQVRSAARILAHAGTIEILQKGIRVNPDDFRGPIRLRLPKKPTK
jgi:hypothetical protein